MNTQRDKFLTETMGECWHDLRYVSDGDWFCDSCKVWIYGYNSHTGHNEEEFNSHVNSSFSTWKGFGKLKSFMCNLPDSESFFDVYIDLLTQRADDVTATFERLTPDHFADAAYEYLQDKTNA